MPTELTPAEIEILRDALNDRESVLAQMWQQAEAQNSVAQMIELCDRLRAVRALADKLRHA